MSDAVSIIIDRLLDVSWQHNFLVIVVPSEWDTYFRICCGANINSRARFSFLEHYKIYAPAFQAIGRKAFEE